jgi:hypothetical protein
MSSEMKSRVLIIRRSLIRRPTVRNRQSIERLTFFDRERSS